MLTFLFVYRIMNIMKEVIVMSNKLMRNEDCTYLYDRSTKTLYVSLSFEDLTDLSNCEDYMTIDVYNYNDDCEPILDLIDYCKSIDKVEDNYDTIRQVYGSEIDEATGQEIVGGNICIEDVDWL